jgi:hypothetical protein
MLKIKDIPNYEGRYKIDEEGNIYGISKSKDNRYINNEWLLKQYQDQNGYLYVTLSLNKKRKTFKVHKLMALTFLNNPENKSCVNHIDSNRKNNNIKNLEWVTHKENMQHALQNGRFDKMKIENSIKMRINKPVLKRWENRKNA